MSMDTLLAVVVVAALAPTIVAVLTATGFVHDFVPIGGRSPITRSGWWCSSCCSWWSAGCRRC
jgi:hypothetical protein